MNFSKYTTISKEELCKELTTSENGLSEEEVTKRISHYGFNMILGEGIQWWNILLRQFKSPFIYLLVVAVLFTFLLQDSIDGLMILLFIALNAVFGFYQEYRSEQTLKLLKRYVAPQVKVKRDGHEVIINSQELVPGDVVMIRQGDIIPADLRFLEAHNVSIDESVLTGESVPAKKNADKLVHQTNEIYKAFNIGFSGTSVLTGWAVGIVLSIGSNTSIGEIAKLTVETTHVSSFEKSISKFSRFILRLILFTLVFVFLANVIIKGGREDIVRLMIFSIALAVSVIPETLPIVTTFSLSRGALNLSRHKVVVKRLSAIEDLGSIDVLCTDKTGTLTENTLVVDEIYSYEGNEKETLFFANVASSPPLRGKKGQFVEPFDLALWNHLSNSEKEKLDEYQIVEETLFDPNIRKNSVVIKRGDKKILVVRGAPETVIEMCSAIKGKSTSHLFEWVSKKGREGFRVIGVAKQESEKGTNLTFLGLISFVDRIKESATHAMKKAEALGVEIKILTGDSKEVAGFVAHQTGLIRSLDQVLTGDEFEALSPHAQNEAVENYCVFARVTPVQKYKIVELLKAKHEVGFLGEGINDAPALKIANVGLVVSSAVDISKEASDIVLLKKSLNVIVDGIREGREVFANTVKYIRATLSSNFGNFYAIAIASLLIDFLPMLPLQILLVNLLTDFPLIAIATDNVDNQELKKPKNYEIHEIAVLATILGLVSTVFDFIFFGLFYRTSEGILQTNWFMGSVLTELVFLYSIRTKLFFLVAKKTSWVLGILSLLVFSITILLPYTYSGQHIFGFVKPSFEHVLIILGVVIVYFFITEMVKLSYYSYFASTNTRASATPKRS